MKKEIYQEIEIPEGVGVEVTEGLVKVKGPKGESERKFNAVGLEFKKEGNKIIIGNKKATKNYKKIINTFASHVKNMITGVTEKFEYKLKVCSSHFPITVEVKDGEVLIKNFLGEKTPRKGKIPNNVEVDIQGELITVKSVSKELAGQVAATLEAITKIRNRDRRVFQDGIFMTSKSGREI
ncbi:MAG: 50S ribosomal protein L6 [Nanoarchaeota archaeon]|nr:50S ribosomal protein L6 [Nanoarchaeota archaeon]MBU1501151.1 50S ribosomal protein L6 [Nanoarchaeota archaeon]MBU2458831.1 50S ribosomal protein L6 [Nanoarchaeota archaeon]